MKKKNIVITALVVMLVVGASIGAALAYFTTSAETSGAGTVVPEVRTRIEEPKPSEWTKHVNIVADADSGPVWVRVRAFADPQYKLTYPGAEAAGWTQQGDWYVYGSILTAGQAADTFDIHIDGVPADAVDGDTIDVIVVHEYTPVTYGADGEPQAPVWPSEGGD